MRKISIILTILFVSFSILSGCGRRKPEVDLSGINRTEVDRIKHTGTTGGKDGEFAYSLSESEKNGFIDLLNQVKLGKRVSEGDALSYGAVSHYTLYFADGETLVISPGRYFKLEDTYYEFSNYDELWDEFIEFNSLN